VIVGQTQNSSSDVPNADNSQRIGWQGITIDLPEDWSLTGFGGDLSSGTLRCDSADPESLTLPVGLECRWIGAKKAPSESQIRSRAESLLAAIQKAAKRAKTEADTSVYEEGGEPFDGRSPAFRFAWRTDRAAAGAIWYCSVCKRVVIVQVYGLGGRPFVRQAEAILQSIRCHGADPKWRTWGLYGLRVDVPADYELVSQKVMNVYLQLLFKRGRSSDTLTVEQWSLANVQLKGAYLDEWFERKRDEAVVGIELDKQERVVNGHDALWLTGKRVGVAALADTVRSTVRFKRAALWFSGQLWECPPSNKTYLVQSLSRRDQPDIVEATASRVRCHRNDDEKRQGE